MRTFKRRFLTEMKKPEPSHELDLFAAMSHQTANLPQSVAEIPSYTSPMARVDNIVCENTDAPAMSGFETRPTQ